MKRIDARTVHLTDEEVAVHDLFHDYLDQGWTTPHAAQKALAALEKELGIEYGDDFVLWISDGTCARTADAVEVSPGWD